MHVKSVEAQCSPIEGGASLDVVLVTWPVAYLVIRDTPEIMDEILTTARDLELEVNEDDIEEPIMGHEDELTTEELQEILNEEHQETQRNVFPEQEEDERGPIPTSAIKDLLKKWEDVRAMVLEWHP
ncbi:uncharacterized protein TNCV_4391051 [Trichonephila clavipes]|nr:uncharacterized protein TNCV_4391051 [Trichonephila clavipes]